MFAQNALVNETGRLQKFAFRLTRNRPDADDLLQSTCLRALEKADFFENGTNLFGWTSKIMFNLFVSGYRHRAQFETQFDPETELANASIAATQDVGAEIANVKQAMMQLTPSHRQVLILIYAREMQYEEVAETLHVPVGTVRSRLSRARRQLQCLLDISAVRLPKTEKSVMGGNSSAPAPLADCRNTLTVFPLLKETEHEIQTTCHNGHGAADGVFGFGHDVFADGRGAY